MASLHPKFDKSVKTTVKEAVHKRNLSERATGIARSRGVTTEEFLNHDAPSPLLCNLDGIMTKPEKHVLLTELELLAGLNDSKCNKGLAEAQIVNVMGVVRKIKTTGFNNFGDLVREFDTLTEYYDVTHYLFDLYTSQSPEDSERLRRANESASLPPIELTYIDSTTSFPKNTSRFWPSIENKKTFAEFFIRLPKEGRIRYI